MTFNDLRLKSSSLQHREETRKTTQSQAINLLYKKAIEMDRDNKEKLSNDIIISKSAEILYSDDMLYIKALSNMAGIGSSLIDNARIRCSTYLKYITEKYDFNQTMTSIEPLFTEDLTFDELLILVKQKGFYLHISDSTLKDVYEMLIAKLLV